MLLLLMSSAAPITSAIGDSRRLSVVIYLRRKEI
jgi:hypothetical protein